MKFLSATFTIAVYLSIAVLPAVAEPPAEAPRKSLEEVADQAGPKPEGPSVYNGEFVQNPSWIAAIYDDDFYTCTGTLVHSLWVLTAAHCVDDPAGPIAVGVGGDYWFLGEYREAVQIKIHPGYDPDDPSSVDLAMIKLASPVATTWLPLIASPTEQPKLDQQLLVVGWGETYTSSPIPDLLQAGVVYVESDSAGNYYPPYCPPAWVAASGFDDFCFGGFSWACPGDSGGPLIGRPFSDPVTGPLSFIYGVTSYGENVGCSEQFFDTIGQSVGPHRAWIYGFYQRPFGDAADEMFFYRDDGLFRFYNVKPNGDVGAPILAGSGYTSGWSSITAVDLDGDSQDEMFFYRDDGLFRYYNVRSDGSLGTPILAGTGYTTGWSSITAVDLDGDGQDEMFFYRDDGLFRYYNIKSDGSLGIPILAGSGYTSGWSSITAVDLDGDGQDEMFFYRDDGLFRYYNVKANGDLGTPIRAGSGYTSGWSSITAVDLDGDYLKP